MSRRGFYWIVAAAAAVLIVGFSLRFATVADDAKVKANPSVGDSSKQPILVNITRGKTEMHAVSMALGLAQSALKDGRQAIVFLNVEAPVFAAKDFSDQAKVADFPPVKKMLADFMAAGGRVLVCGHCAHVVKLKQEDMLEGVKVLSQGELFAIIRPGTVVFSY